MDFSKGEGYAIINEDEYGGEGVEAKRVSQKVTSPDILAVKGLGLFEQFKAISAVRSLLGKWYVSNFKIESGRNISLPKFLPENVIFRVYPHQGKQDLEKAIRTGLPTISKIPGSGVGTSPYSDRTGDVSSRYT